MDDNRSEKRPSPGTIPGSLLERYSTSGPRYTSYPTAPQFKTEFDEPKIIEEWESTNAEKQRGLSLYVHIPFCRTRCLYCGCYTTFGQTPETVDSYVESVLREADRMLEILGSGRKVEQLALGGGTPTYLSREQMSDLVEGLKSRFEFPAAGERSLEIDPVTVDEDYLDLLIELGFNRFSFGVQDLDPDVQKIVNRPLPEETIRGLLTHLRRRGHDAINLDLIYGLPGQTEESFGETIRKVSRLKPCRVALFGYAHVPWVSPHQKGLERYHLPDPGERMSLFGLAYEILLDAGYAHVGMDHFALPEDELILSLNSRTLTRNFMGYTTRRGLDLVGLGVSSISSVGSTYTQNEKEIGIYIDRAGGSTWIKGLVMNREDEIRKEIILDLFCNFHLDIASVERKFEIDFRSHFGRELESLEPMREDGLVMIGKDSLAVTDLGRFFIRNICMNFDQYLAGDNPDARYSKTI